MRIDAIWAEPLLVPLKEPFSISRASVLSTRAALVRARLADGRRSATGYGEAALPLGSDVEPRELLAAVGADAERLEGRTIGEAADISRLLDDGPQPFPCVRSALGCALLDGWARRTALPLYAALGAVAAPDLVTDITLPIGEPRHLAELARGYWATGFRCFKIKVGKSLEADRRTLELVAAATPEASLIFDANEGFAAEQALQLLAAAAATGLAVRCFEQPCARGDIDGMRRVRDEGGAPVVADEAVAELADLERLHAARAIDGVNLKLVKMGGIDRCIEIGRAALDMELKLMVGAMIESRLGLTAMAHVVAVLGGAEWVDLDTAFLLAHDPFVGGLRAAGAELSLPTEPGLAIALADEQR